MKTVLRNVALICAITLAACVPNGQQVETTRRPSPDISLPAMKSFPMRTHALGVARSNSDIARDILDLTFQLESGKQIERLSRFETPVKLVTTTRLPAQASRDLDALLLRLRKEARIDITRGTNADTANILVTTLPRATLQRSVPQAACFVVPRVRSWDEFLRARSTGKLDWSTLEIRETVSVFIPDDVAPQEMRDCLHEEIAQAMGPVNDLYRVGDSVFNDDNIQTTLTAFDMTALRAYYDPAIHSGMTRADMAAVLPGILARTNPGGQGIAPAPAQPTTREWKNNLETALGSRGGAGRRLAAAKRAVKIAQDKGWNDNRLGFSYYALGRLALGIDSKTALDSFTRAYALYAKLYGTGDIHTAHVAVQLAAFALSSGETDQAIDLVNASLPAVLRTENAALLSSLLMIKAEALDYTGKTRDAATVRLDSLAWARYGFGSDDTIAARAAEIAALTPRRNQQGS